MKYLKGEPIGCPKCNHPTKETKELSMSSEWVGSVCVIIALSIMCNGI